jgi:hypothetical protein
MIGADDDEEELPLLLELLDWLDADAELLLECDDDELLDVCELLGWDEDEEELPGGSYVLTCAVNVR